MALENLEDDPTAQSLKERLDELNNVENDEEPPKSKCLGVLV